MENDSLIPVQSNPSPPPELPWPHYDRKIDAVACFAKLYFSLLPIGWLEEMLFCRGEPSEMPKFNGLFLVEDEEVAQKIKRNFCEVVLCEDEEGQRLIDSGWFFICPTGLFAREVDGVVFLGIDGDGYDFAVAHWEPLYDLLGFKWHLDD